MSSEILNAILDQEIKRNDKFIKETNKFINETKKFIAEESDKNVSSNKSRNE